MSNAIEDKVPSKSVSGRLKGNVLAKFEAFQESEGLTQSAALAQITAKWYQMVENAPPPARFASIDPIQFNIAFGIIVALGLSVRKALQALGAKRPVLPAEIAEWRKQWEAAAIAFGKVEAAVGRLRNTAKLIETPRPDREAAIALVRWSFSWTGADAERFRSVLQSALKPWTGVVSPPVAPLADGENGFPLTVSPRESAVVFQIMSNAIEAEASSKPVSGRLKGNVLAKFEAFQESEGLTQSAALAQITAEWCQMVENAPPPARFALIDPIQFNIAVGIVVELGLSIRKALRALGAERPVLPAEIAEWRRQWEAAAFAFGKVDAALGRLRNTAKLIETPQPDREAAIALVRWSFSWTGADAERFRSVLQSALKPWTGVVSSPVAPLADAESGLPPPPPTQEIKAP
jgi:predicted transcriptional regulator